MNTYPDVTADAEHAFLDPFSHTMVVLVIGDDYESTGVRHAHVEFVYEGKRREGCTALAHVSPELDCAFCPECHWQTRISGAWFTDLVYAQTERDRPPLSSPDVAESRG